MDTGNERLVVWIASRERSDEGDGSASLDDLLAACSSPALQSMALSRLQARDLKACGPLVCDLARDAPPPAFVAPPLSFCLWFFAFTAFNARL